MMWPRAGLPFGVSRLVLRLSFGRCKAPDGSSGRRSALSWTWSRKPFRTGPSYRRFESIPRMTPLGISSRLASSLLRQKWRASGCRSPGGLYSQVAKIWIHLRRGSEILGAKVGDEQRFRCSVGGGEQAAVRRGNRREAGIGEAAVLPAIVHVGDEHLVLEGAHRDHLARHAFGVVGSRKAGRGRDQLGARPRQPAHIRRELGVVANQDADPQPAVLDDAGRRLGGFEQAALVIAVEMRFAVDNRCLLAVNEDRAVVAATFRSLGKAGDDGDTRVERDLGEAGHHFPAWRLRKMAHRVARTVAWQGKLRRDEQFGALFRGLVRSLLNQHEIGSLIAGARPHLHCRNPHHLSSECIAPSRRGRSPKRAISENTSAAIATKNIETEAMVGV